MGDHEGWPQPSGLLPNGLLASDSASVIRDLDMERWSKAEKRTAELIACIEPTPLSEQRRNAVAFYVQQLIMKCLPCKVFTFGSVPLKTYLPDGDIDLTAFCEDESLKETWASQVRDMLESEEKNENAEFRVKEVQYIQAEVKIIKCLVENIVVDISFEQLGGLCTLCFLEEVDHLINKNHLFKRSIILIKAWCYYESRILGAHHALISTYALETLVLYIFHVFNNSFDGPLEVLYRFLEFFSNFDWDNYCLSLCGPVPISSLPDVTADPPRKDGGELLLSKVFLDACSSVYGVCLEGQENQEQPFITKHINVIDPLRVSNNLGRSVNKGNFYRIRSAFAFGAKRLARLLECPKESIVFELNQFFTNTWERHGSGIRLDVPTRDLWQLRPTNQHLAFDHKKNAPNGKKQDVNVAIHEIEVEVRTSSRLLTSQSDNYPGDNNSQSNDYPLSTQTQGQILHRSRMSDQNHKGIASHTQTDRTKRNWKPDNTVSEVQVRYLFARTRSSPELTDTSRDISFQMRHNKPIENGKTQMASPKVDGSRRKNTVSEIVSSHCSGSSSDDPSSGVRHSCSHHMVDTAADSNRISGGHADEPGNGLIRKDHGPVTGTQQEEQDPVNLMTSYSVHNFGGQLPMPLNLASTHVSLPISQSVLASMGFGQKNIPTNVPLIDPYWATNLQFHQGLMPYPLGQYIPPGVGVSTNSEDLLGPGVKNFGSAEVLCGDAGCEYWQERDVPSVNSNFPSCIASSWSSLEAHKRFTKETQGSARDEYVENFHQQDNQADEAYPDVRISSARFCSASQSGSVRSKTSSESSWDGSSARVSKVARDKRGKKTDCSAATSSDTYGKGKNISEQATNEADDEDRDWKITSAMGTESGERSTSLQYASSLDVSRHNLPGSEGTHTSGSDTVMPITPMTLGPASRQRVMDNSGVVPYTFYPTGPPVPFLTMLPVYNFPAGSGPSDASSSKMVVEDGPENSESRQNFDSSEGHDAPDVLNICGSMTRAIGTESSEELKGDILDCDFATHWQNLQYARFCQNSRHLTPAISSSPGVVPPMYLQGRFPWDVPGRPLTANVNVISQLMGYGPRFVPIAPLQSIPNRPTTVYQQYVDEPVKYRSGTGTYLPNPKASYRERHSSGTRRNSYNYDRSDHADREGNWNVAKARAAARSHNRNQVEKSRVDRQLVNDNRSDRSWVRPEPLSSFQSQNGPVQFSTSQSSSGPMAYGMYPLTGMNASGIMSNGQTVPSVVMLYPYDHNSSYVSSGEQLDFGTLGPMDFVGMNDALHSADVTRVRGPFVDQRHHGNSTQQSSPDQPSSPHFQRRI